MHKRSKGRVRGKSLSTALALLFFTAIGAPAGAGELYGLVVGIDDRQRALCPGRAGDARAHSR